MDSIRSYILEAKQKYPTENLDCVLNESTQSFDLMYCSHNNSFVIKANIAPYSSDGINMLIRIFDELNISHTC